MTYEVQQTRWDRLIRRVSGSIGPGSRVSETLSELFPVLDVESVPAELLFLSGTFLGQGAADLSASVAENSHVQLFNPVASGKIVTLTTVFVSSTNTQDIRFGTEDVALPDDVGNVIARDTRAGVTLRLSAQVRSDQTAAGNPLFGTVRLEPQTTFYIKDDNAICVLAPGTGYTFSTTVVNTNLRVTFFWRERVAQESELTF